MVLDAALLSTQHYKVSIKGKVEQSWEWSSTLPYTSEKRAFGLHSTKVANFTLVCKHDGGYKTWLEDMQRYFRVVQVSEEDICQAALLRAGE